MSQTVEAGPESASLSGDVWGGLAAMLVALPSAMAFGMLAYTVIGPEYAGAGALAGIFGAAALGIVASIVGKTGGLISAPCAPAAAVLSAMVTGLRVHYPGSVIDSASIFSIMALTVLLASVLQIMYGALGGGSLIKFIPYPVVSGYLSSIGVLLALGQIPKLFGLPEGTQLIKGLVTPELWKWEGLAVGVVTIVLMNAAPRLTKKVPAAIIGLCGGIVSYFVFALFSAKLLVLHNNPLVIGEIQEPGSFLEAIGGRATSLFSMTTASVEMIIIPALTLSILLSIDTLKTCVSLDTVTRSRHNSDRELIGQGIGNMVSSLVGGMPGAGTMGPTMVNVTSGGRTPRSGIIEGSFVLLVLFLLSRVIAWVPIGALAGILLVIAWRMFDKSIFRLMRYPAGRLDFAVIAVVILVAVTVDLIAATGVGVALAILLFIRDQALSSVVKRKYYLNQVSSKTRRLSSQREVLNRLGDQGVFCELQGNLFFGTADQLFSQLEADLRTRRFVLLDMRRVKSMDSTAAHIFEQMNAQLTERGGQLLFSGVPSGLLEERNLDHYLVRNGVAGKGSGVMISETLDGALEWIEERILEMAGVDKKSEESLLDLEGFDLFKGLDDGILNELSKCVAERSLTQGEKAFSAGDPGDEIFLLRRGSVSVMLPLEGGKRHYLATIGRGDFFGELSFLDRNVRSADVEAKVPTDLYVLSRGSFNERLRSNPTVGLQVFASLAFSIADRLRQADAELRVLE